MRILRYDKDMRTKRDDQKAQRDWLRDIIRATGLTAGAIAKRAGLAPSTITRFLHGEVGHVLKADTLTRISQTSGAPLPVEVLAPVRIETNVEVMKIALAEARDRLYAIPKGEEYRDLEAEAVSHIYDVLMDALRSGGDIETARLVLRNSHERERSRRGR